MSSSPEPSSSPTNGLYCGEDASEVVPSNTDDSWVNDQPQPSFSSGFLPQTDETYITNLIDSEPHFMPQSDYLHRCRNRSVDVTARQDSINWILKVHGYYRFRPVTAMLSVNYFDRFLSSHSFPVNGWPFQLLSVACLSLAAKMEETHVPLLVNLQLLEPGFVFEPKTVQRMELWVMVNLDWRLRSVTPFDYLHYFISKLPSCDFNRIFEFSSALILSTTRVIDFLGFSPSTLAEAAVLCAAGERLDATPTGGDGEYYNSFNDRAKKVHCITHSLSLWSGCGIFEILGDSFINIYTFESFEDLRSIEICVLKIFMFSSFSFLSFFGFYCKGNGEKLSPTNGGVPDRYVPLGSAQGPDG
ncbi:hypothetical protein K2173_023884 [Erythroxylum novogranatense]|uniref:B-like cyclin n=1 Tax=Erythroxylum novogranatense TaxID=1862640 RepID=A0AAV8TS53_9ROSI|nr:hypothetical protein K2173_023884 [Erythroxylum novogranatense]